MEKLTEEEIEKRLKDFDRWVYDNGVLFYQDNFSDFSEAMNFVNEIALMAEDMGHHPKIEVNYNVVKLSLYTHDVNGITEKDFEFAQEVQNV